MLFNAKGCPPPPVSSLNTLVQAQCTFRSGGSSTGLFTTICAVCTDHNEPGYSDRDGRQCPLVMELSLILPENSNNLKSF